MTEQNKTLNLTSLYRAIDQERGNVDPWDFKAYPLGVLFYRFVCRRQSEWLESAAGVRLLDDQSDADFSRLRQDSIKALGFFISPADSFESLLRLGQNGEDLGAAFAQAVSKFEDSAEGSASKGDVVGILSSLDTSSTLLAATPEGRSKALTKLFELIGDIDIAEISEFGAVYEQILDNYASRAGKTGGEFFTPLAVSELLAKLALAGRTEISSVYDPTCGTGSTLLRVAQIAGIENLGLGLYGQELNPETSRFARMSMFMHGLNYDQFEIETADTIFNPRFTGQPKFDAVVAHPPIGLQLKGDEVDGLKDDPRFAEHGGLVPRSRADLAFVQHALSYLSENGVAALMIAPAALYREGVERKIRKYLVKNNLIDSVTLLPHGTLTTTSMQMCILVIKKNRISEDVLFINAEDSFPNQPLSPDQLAEATSFISDLSISRTTKLGVSALVSVQDLANRDFDYDLSPSRHFGRIAATTPDLVSKIDQLVGKELRASARQAQREIESAAEPVLREFGLAIPAEDLYSLNRSRAGENSKLAVLREQHTRKLDEALAKFGDTKDQIDKALDRLETEFLNTRREVMQTRSQASQLAAVLRPLQSKFVEDWQSYEEMQTALMANSELFERLDRMEVTDVQSFMLWADEVFRLFEAVCVRENTRAEAGHRIPGTIRANSKRVYRQVWSAWTRDNAESVLSSLAASRSPRNRFNLGPSTASMATQVEDENRNLGKFVRVQLVSTANPDLSSDVRVQRDSNFNLTISQWLMTLIQVWGDPNIACKATLFMPLADSEFSFSLPEGPMVQIGQAILDAVEKAGTSQNA